MTVRHLIGDLGLAILLALPLAALAKPLPPSPHPKSFPAAPHLASTQPLASSERIGLLG